MDNLSNIARPRLHHVYHKKDGQLHPEEHYSEEPWPFFVTTSQPQHSSLRQMQTNTDGIMANISAFAEYKRVWEAALSRPTPLPPHLHDAQQRLNDLYTDFKNYFDDVKPYYDNSLPRGRLSFLHCARVARKERDEEALKTVSEELRSLVKAYLHEDMKTLAGKLCRLKKSEEAMLGQATNDADFRILDEDQLLNRYGAEVLSKPL